MAGPCVHGVSSSTRSPTASFPAVDDFKAGWLAGTTGSGRRRGASGGHPAHLRGLKRTATHTLFFSLPSRPLYCAMAAISTRGPVANHLERLWLQLRCTWVGLDALARCSQGPEDQPNTSLKPARQERKSAERVQSPNSQAPLPFSSTYTPDDQVVAQKANQVPQSPAFSRAAFFALRAAEAPT